MSDAKNYITPDGALIVAVLMYTPGICGISGINDDGTPEFDGNGTKHLYDDQVEAKRKGKIIFLCDDGEEWTFDQLSIVPEDEETEEENDDV